MFSWAFLFLIIAIIAGVLGLTGIAGHQYCLDTVCHRYHPCHRLCGRGAQASTLTTGTSIDVAP